MDNWWREFLKENETIQETEIMEAVSRAPDGSLYPEEDFSLFLDELSVLLNKYHYGFYRLALVKIMNENSLITGFRGDGEAISCIINGKNILDKGEDSE